MAAKTITRYRDRETGCYVEKSTWKRSHEQGGKRYKRERVRRRPSPATPHAPSRPAAPKAGAVTEEAVPAEFLEFEDMYFGGEEFGEEQEY